MKRFPAGEYKAQRLGVVTVMVLVVLLLLSGIIIQFVRRAVADRRQGRQALVLAQTEQLAEAALLRLQQKVSATGDYSGETWNISPGVIHKTNSGQVLITVEDQFATVVAQYPLESPTPARVTRRIRLSHETTDNE